MSNAYAMTKTFCRNLRFTVKKQEKKMIERKKEKKDKIIFKRSKIYFRRILL